MNFQQTKSFVTLILGITFTVTIFIMEDGELGRNNPLTLPKSSCQPPDDGVVDIAFMGDSRIRQLFLAFVKVYLERKLPNAYEEQVKKRTIKRHGLLLTVSRSLRRPRPFWTRMESRLLLDSRPGNNTKQRNAIIIRTKLKLTLAKILHLIQSEDDKSLSSLPRLILMSSALWTMARSAGSPSDRRHRFKGQMQRLMTVSA